jgi:hypothetical protein
MYMVTSKYSFETSRPDRLKNANFDKVLRKLIGDFFHQFTINRLVGESIYIHGTFEIV